MEPSYVEPPHSSKTCNSLIGVAVEAESNLTMEFSTDNLDYNSLKHEIKVHTTRDQATAIAIPGHQDPALRKFEDALYLELCRQHDRVDMFVSSKADEISRRLGMRHRLLKQTVPMTNPCLEHLATSIEKYAAKSKDSTSPIKRQRRFAKHERDLRQCDNEIHALARFSKAQIIAFRKILKKYKVGYPQLSNYFANTNHFLEMDWLYNSHIPH